MLINVNVKWRENMLHTVVAGVHYEFDDANSISFIFTFYVRVYEKTLNDSLIFMYTIRHISDL